MHKISNAPQRATPTRGLKRVPDRKDSEDSAPQGPPNPPDDGANDGRKPHPLGIDYSGEYRVEGTRIVRLTDGLTLLRLERPDPKPRQSRFYLVRLSDSGKSVYLSSVYRDGEFEDERSERRYRIGKPEDGLLRIAFIGPPTRKAPGWGSWA